jgi:hypothetical protein
MRPQQRRQFSMSWLPLNVDRAPQQISTNILSDAPRRLLGQDDDV